MSKQKLGYGTGKWAGAPLYQCNACPFNTAEKEDIEEHVRLSHAHTPSVAEVAAEAKKED